MELSLAQRMAFELMGENDLITWEFKFNNGKLRFGLCSFRQRTIYLSKPLTKLNDEHAVRETILHEIAHALVGIKEGHGPVWRKKARELGCSGERCYGSEVVTPARKYIGTCPACHKQIERFRRTKIACGACCRANGGYFYPQYLFKWERK